MSRRECVCELDRERARTGERNRECCVSGRGSGRERQCECDRERVCGRGGDSVCEWEKECVCVRERKSV